MMALLAFDVVVITLSGSRLCIKISDVILATWTFWYIFYFVLRVWNTWFAQMYTWLCLASAIVIASSTLKYLTFLNIHASLALLSENNFYVRAPSVWNILPSKIRDTSRSLAYFKSSLLNYYLEQIYNPDNPRTFKSVCVKCHSIRSLDSLFNSEDMLLTFYNNLFLIYIYCNLL